MSVQLNENYVKGFISDAEVKNIQPMITTAHNLLRTKQGPGNDFLGWVTLPFEYDKAEFEAIKAIKQIPDADRMESEELLKAALKKMF